MSKLSYRILYFLDRNSRATLSKIAKNLKTSEQRISYSVKSMIKNGITEFLEIGPGKVLSSLVKKMN